MPSLSAHADTASCLAAAGERANARAVAAALSAYGAAHLVVDAACVGVVLHIALHGAFAAVGAWTLILTYNVLAFAGQAFVGLAVDRWRVPRCSAAGGCLLVACAIACAGLLPVPAVCLAGLGNALFHVGGGAVSINLTPERATGPGAFVAPGAFGLALGAITGSRGLFVGWPFLLLLAGACAVILYLKTPPVDYRRRPVATGPGRFELVLLLLCFAIAMRSVTASVAVWPWKPDLQMFMMLTAAAVVGKLSGGILADRFGWLRVAVTAMLISVPMVSFGVHVPYLAVAGMLLLQIPMSVTLAALARLFPGAPAFSFGLASLALIIGSIQTFATPMPLLSNTWVNCLLLLASTAALWAGLRLLPGRRAAPHGNA